MEKLRPGEDAMRKRRAGCRARSRNCDTKARRLLALAGGRLILTPGHGQVPFPWLRRSRGCAAKQPNSAPKNSFKFNTHRKDLPRKSAAQSRRSRARARTSRLNAYARRGLPARSGRTARLPSPAAHIRTLASPARPSIWQPSSRFKTLTAMQDTRSTKRSPRQETPRR